MKIVIDIPEEDYEFTKNARTARTFNTEYYVNLILNGIYLDSMLTNIKSNIKMRIKEETSCPYGGNCQGSRCYSQPCKILDDDVFAILDEEIKE